MRLQHALTRRGIHLPRPLIISLRNTFRRTGRLALTLFTLTMAGAIFITVFNVRITLHDYIDRIGDYFTADVTLDFTRPYRLNAVRQTALEVPGVFDEPRVPLRRFATEMAWQIGPSVGARPPRVDLRLIGARFANDDAEGEFTARWNTGDGEGFGKGGRLPGVLELAGKLSRGRATQVVRYLPLGIPAAARDYVRHAVQGGQGETAQFRAHGDLWD